MQLRPASRRFFRLVAGKKIVLRWNKSRGEIRGGQKIERHPQPLARDAQRSSRVRALDRPTPLASFSTSSRSFSASFCSSSQPSIGGRLNKRLVRDLQRARDCG